ncbi:MAG TPA: ABATE domain-containing protein, partial [Gemmatimonadales bacterium]|nr:ABATE domain-containing protein [Gemmatimonadales bacterium]
MIPKVPRRVPEDPPMLFVGNLGWVDFVNTRYAGRTGPVEALTGPAAVARWLKAAGMRTEPDGTGAVTRAPRLLAEAFRLRAALLETAVALSSGRPVPDPALEAINRVLRAG